MKTKILLCVCGLVFMTTLAEATVIEFHSGNGNPPAIWGPDSLVRFKPWHNTAVPNVPSAQDFVDVRTLDTLQPKSLPAVIVPSGTNDWEPLAEDPAALPVFNLVASHVFNVGSSALFGIPIEIQGVGAVDLLTLEFTYVVDNYLGYVSDDILVEGLYFGAPGYEMTLPDTVNYVEYDPADRENTRFLKGSVELDVTNAYTGEDTYWLYMNVTDRGVAAAGIMFSGRITAVANPEPATLFIWAVLGCAMCGWLSRRNPHLC